ncbi:superoxide dismutase [Betaproteobacteria bacterium GR16-43]|nr:superoxide dismutase [Betaproteobacteria bacterium GR16-43]
MVRIAFTLAVATLAAGCAGTSPGSAATASNTGATAVAKLESTKGNAVAGTATFVQRGDEVYVTVNVTGLPPNTSHGFHVHEKGDCSSGDGMSTGGHFNPTGAPHAKHEAAAHHAGDLPSLTADAYGNASINFKSKTITVGSGITDVIGRGLIVHRDPDDYTTQPTGNAGPRVACAVIQKA